MARDVGRGRAFQIVATNARSEIHQGSRGDWSCCSPQMLGLRMAGGESARDHRDRSGRAQAPADGDKASGVTVNPNLTPGRPPVVSSRDSIRQIFWTRWQSLDRTGIIRGAQCAPQY